MAVKLTFIALSPDEPHASRHGATFPYRFGPADARGGFQRDGMTRKGKTMRPVTRAAIGGLFAMWLAPLSAEPAPAGQVEAQEEQPAQPPAQTSEQEARSSG